MDFMWLFLFLQLLFVVNSNLTDCSILSQLNSLCTKLLSSQHFLNFQFYFQSPYITCYNTGHVIIGPNLKDTQRLRHSLL